MESAADVVEKYQRQPFSKGLIPFRPAVNTINSSFAKIRAKQDGRQRWVIIDKNTDEPALFSHAGVFAQSDLMETGNYVPSNETVPPGLELKNIQRRANAKCFYTYIINSHGDLSLYEGQWTLDEYIAKVDGFNPTNVPRRAYLSGQEERYRSRFWMQTPMFLKKEDRGTEAPAPEYLHPWVLRADRQSKVFRANPDRPRVWMKHGATTVPITDTVPGFLQEGDVVAFSFTVTYHITSMNWFPQFHPADIVLMKQGGGEPTDYSAPGINLYNRPPPALMGEDCDESGGSTELQEGGQAILGSVEKDKKEVPAGNGDAVEEQSPVDVKDDVPEGKVRDSSVDENGLDGNSVVGEERRSFDTLASTEDGDEGEGEGKGFEIVAVSESEGGGVPEDLVGGAVQGGERPNTRAGGAKAGRGARKRA